MLTVAKAQDEHLRPVSETHKRLSKRVQQLRTEGSTALGPALVFSIGFGSKRPGSQVIL
jgi:hypothetical protein